MSPEKMCTAAGTSVSSRVSVSSSGHSGRSSESRLLSRFFDFLKFPVNRASLLVPDRHFALLLDLKMCLTSPAVSLFSCLSHFSNPLHRAFYCETGPLTVVEHAWLARDLQGTTRIPFSWASTPETRLNRWSTRKWEWPRRHCPSVTSCKALLIVIHAIHFMIVGLLASAFLLSLWLCSCSGMDTILAEMIRNICFNSSRNTSCK